MVIVCPEKCNKNFFVKIADLWHGQIIQHVNGCVVQCSNQMHQTETKNVELRHKKCLCYCNLIYSYLLCIIIVTYKNRNVCKPIRAGEWTFTEESGQQTGIPGEKPRNNQCLTINAIQSVTRCLTPNQQRKREGVGIHQVTQVRLVVYKTCHFLFK